MKPGRARSGPRAVEQRAEILRNASEAFARYGYHGTSVELIAKTLGMRKGNLYHFFRSKEDLLFFCHDYALDLVLQLMDDVVGGTEPPDRQLHRLVVGFVHTMLDELGGCWLTQEIHPLSPDLRRRVIDKRDRFERGVRALIADGMDRGMFARADVKLRCFAILGALNWVTRWYSSSGEADPHVIATSFADFVVAGLSLPSHVDPSR
ncbi:MAG TPA: TetR/AcrR family transcriptional regulator [Candidatus Krumholzibacteria bacterium]|jgi:AcrR family transcriptional regulator